MSSERFNLEANCCIEHHAQDDPAVAELVVTHDGAKADLCKGEAACWTSYELSGTCDAQPAWAASAALRCYSSEENCGQAGALRGPIEDWAEIVNEEGCNGGIARFFHHCLEEWKEEGAEAGADYACGMWGYGRGEIDWPATSVMVDAFADGSLCADSLAAPAPALSVGGGTAWNGVDGRINQTCTKHKCLDLEPHWRAVDVDGDMMLNATEVAALLERLQRIVTINEGADVAEPFSYPFPERIVALGDSGGDEWTDSFGLVTWGLPGDNTLSMDEFFHGLHALRHAGEPPCPGGCWCPSHCGQEQEHCIETMSAVSDEYCVATPGKDVWWALLTHFCDRGGGGGGDRNLFAGILGAVILVLWVLPSVIYGLVKLLSCACRTRATAAEQNTQARATVAKLDAAAASAARLRFRVSGTLMQFGWMLTVLANAPMLFAVAGGWRCATAFSSWWGTSSITSPRARGALD